MSCLACILFQGGWGGGGDKCPPNEIRWWVALDTRTSHTQDSNWPVLCHGLAMLLATLSVSRGVSTIEPVNKVVVPILLFIIVFCFYWALFLPYAADGIIHMFSPSWGECIMHVTVT